MVIFFLAVLLNISAFSYILWSGYFGDDAQNVDLPGRAMLAGQTWLQLSQHAASEWVFKTGRPFPLSVYTVPLFHLFSSRIAYKVFILILSLLSFFSFSLLIYRVSKNIRLALLYLLFLPCFVSSRYWYEAQSFF